MKLSLRSDHNRNLAADPARVEGQLRLGTELIRERPLDELAAVALAPRPALGHGDPALAPGETRAALRPVLLHLPGDGEAGRALTQRTVLHSVRCQLVQGERERLGRGRWKPHARSFDDDLSRGGNRVAVRIELRLD